MAGKSGNWGVERRDAVLNAALKEFVLMGYDGASTNVIAREAGISKALMFHYVGSKRELFLMVFDYFSVLLDEEYYQKILYDEGDIFERLYQSLLLQIGLLKKYPWIFEFHKLSEGTDFGEINSDLLERNSRKNVECGLALFDSIDEDRFRTDLDAGKCKQVIYWTLKGFADSMMDRMKSSGYANLDYAAMEKELEDLFVELRHIFYRPEFWMEA